MRKILSSEFTVMYHQEKHQLFWAANNDNTDFFQKIFEKEENDPSFLLTKNIPGLTVLHYAIKFCKVDTVYFLLAKAGSSLIDVPDNEGNTLLHTAIEVNNPDKVQAVLNQNPNLKLKNNDNETAICLAKKNKSIDKNIIVSLKNYIETFKKNRDFRA